jgi:hypothetical protein
VSEETEGRWPTSRPPFLYIVRISAMLGDVSNGSQAVRVAAYLQVSATAVAVQLHSTGIGLSPRVIEQFPLCFEAFEQLEPCTKVITPVGLVIDMKLEY